MVVFRFSPYRRKLSSNGSNNFNSRFSVGNKTPVESTENTPIDIHSLTPNINPNILNTNVSTIPTNQNLDSYQISSNESSNVNSKNNSNERDSKSSSLVFPYLLEEHENENNNKELSTINENKGFTDDDMLHMVDEQFERTRSMSFST